MPDDDSQPQSTRARALSAPPGPLPLAPRPGQRPTAPPPLVRRSSTWPPGGAGRGRSSTWPPAREEPEQSSTWPRPTRRPSRQLDLGWPKGDLIDENEPDLDLDLDLDLEAPTGDYDEYGFSQYVNAGDCGCGSASDGTPGDEALDLEALARELYQLLRREAYVERERLGRPWPAP